MKFYLAIALLGLTQAIKLKGDDKNAYIPHDSNTMPVWALRSVNVHQGMIADEKSYGDHSTKSSNKCKETWLDFGTNDGKE